MSTANDPNFYPFAKSPPIDERDSFFRDIIPKLLNEIGNSRGASNDVTFVVEDQEFTANRLLLAAQSPVFQDLLVNQSIDLSIAIPIFEKSSAAFSYFLEFLHFRKLEISKLDQETAIEIALLSIDYQVDILTLHMVKCLANAVNKDNVHRMLEFAVVLNSPDFLNACHKVIAQEGRRFLEKPTFSELSERAVIEVLSRETVRAPEIDILFAVERWQQKNTVQDLNPVLEHVRMHMVRLDGQSLKTTLALSKFLADNNVDLERVGAPANGNMLESGHPVGSFGNLMTPGAMDGQGPFFSFDESPDYFIGSKKDVWATFRLEGLMTVESMSFEIRRICYDANQDNGIMTGFKITASTDGKDWQEVGGAKFRHGNFWGKLLVMFPPRPMQFVKLWVRGPGTYGSSLVFVCSFSSPAKSITPEDKQRYEAICAEAPNRKLVALFCANDPESVVIVEE